MWHKGAVQTTIKPVFCQKTTGMLGLAQLHDEAFEVVSHRRMLDLLGGLDSCFHKVKYIV